MKNLFLAFALIFSVAVSAQEQKETRGAAEQGKAKPQVVEASCGQCNFGMKGGGCSLAVKIDGQPYFVDGTTIHDHGDAHAADGFCAAVRQAEVTGQVVDGRFKASSFKLLPAKAADKK